MKILLLFMFVAVALATETEERKLAEKLTDAFNITIADGIECIKKAGATNDDMEYLVRSVDMSESEITDIQSLRRANCAALCAVKKRGEYLGKVIDLEDVSNFVDMPALPDDLSEKLLDSARVCKQQVGSEDDECMVGYKFLKCVYQRTRLLMEKS